VTETPQTEPISEMKKELIVKGLSSIKEKDDMDPEERGALFELLIFLQHEHHTLYYVW